MYTHHTDNYTRYNNIYCSPKPVDLPRKFCNLEECGPKCTMNSIADESKRFFERPSPLSPTESPIFPHIKKKSSPYRFEVPCWQPIRAFNGLVMDNYHYDGSTPVTGQYRNHDVHLPGYHTIVGTENIRRARVSTILRSQSNQTESQFNQRLLTQPNIHKISQFYGQRG